MFELTHERPCDARKIETLLDTAFGADRRCKTSYQYRVSVPPVPYLRFVARDDGDLIGTIRYWPVSVGSGREALLLGPIAVVPGHGARGVGGALMRHSLAVAAEAGHGAVLLVGDVDYYGRFGFRHASPEGIVMPGERAERLLVRELAPGGLRGVAGSLAPCQFAASPETGRLAVETGSGLMPALADAGRWLTHQLDFDLIGDPALAPVQR